MSAQPRTLYEKIWDAHVVERRADGTCRVYADRHLAHEVTSPQAFERLRRAGRTVRRPDLTLAVADHNQPTPPRADARCARLPIANPSRPDQLAAPHSEEANPATPSIYATAQPRPPPPLA